MQKTPQTPRSIVKLAFPASIPVLIAVAKAIVVGLQGNASFPNPDPSIPVLQAAIADLETAEAAARSRAKEAIATRNEKRAALVALLQQLKGFVQKILDANREHAPALAHSVAMDVRKPSTRRPRTFVAKHGKLPGTVDLVTPAGKHVAYQWQLSADAGKTWQDAPPTTRARTTVVGLVTGASYSFRVRNVTKTGASAWSEPTSILVV